MRLRFAGHPLHPALVHFPLALWFTAVLWDVVGCWQAGTLWWQLAYWSLALGLVLAFPAIVTGFLDYLALPPDAAGMNVAINHMMAMMTATAAFGASWVARALNGAAQAPSLWAIAFAVGGAVLLAVGGWLGGTLVYRHGVGRDGTIAERRPMAER